MYLKNEVKDEKEMKTNTMSFFGNPEIYDRRYDLSRSKQIPSETQIHLSFVLVSLKRCINAQSSRFLVTEEELFLKQETKSSFLMYEQK